MHFELNILILAQESFEICHILFDICDSDEMAEKG